MPSPYDHFVAFGVDNGRKRIVTYLERHTLLTSSTSGGLEKLLRLTQSALLVLTSYPFLLAYLLPSSPLSVLVSTETLLVGVQDHLNIVRRWMRAFRFLESLGASLKLYSSPPAASAQSQGRSLDEWLDVLALTCFGLFGMVESITLFDVAPVDGLGIFGKEQSDWMNLEAHKFWFVGLYASAVSAGWKLFRVLAYQPVPTTTNGDVLGASEGKTAAEEKEDIKKAAEKRKEERVKWAKEVSEKTTGLTLSLVADVLDLTIPAATLGWVDLSDGIVGTAMLCSSVIMVLQRWKGVGGELDRWAA